MKVPPPRKYQDLLDAIDREDEVRNRGEPIDGALVLLNKQEANVLLEALEMYGSIHNAIPGGSAGAAFLIIDKIAAAGKLAGWEAQVDSAPTPPLSEPETD